MLSALDAIPEAQTSRLVEEMVDGHEDVDMTAAVSLQSLFIASM